jgi:putative membrane protein
MGGPADRGGRSLPAVEEITMHRRLILAGLAVATAAPAAFAQDRAGQPAAPAAPPAADRRGPAESEHIRRTLRIGSAALLTSRMALQKAQASRVKQFAQFEVAEQETIAEVIATLIAPQAATTGAGVRLSDDAALVHLDEKGRQLVQKLQGTSAGADFDRDYVLAQIDGHGDLLDAQEAYLRAGREREHLNIARLARTQILEHIILLDGLAAELGARRG